MDGLVISITMPWKCKLCPFNFVNYVPLTDLVTSNADVN